VVRTGDGSGLKRWLQCACFVTGSVATDGTAASSPGPNHEKRWLEIAVATIDFDGVPVKLFSAFDLTERKQAESQARLLAITDPLTGLDPGSVFQSATLPFGWDIQI